MSIKKNNKIDELLFTYNEQDSEEQIAYDGSSSGDCCCDCEDLCTCAACAYCC